MSLRWSTTHCVEDVNNDIDRQVTEALITATVGIGMPFITEANAERFAQRLYAFQRVHGPLLVQITDGGYTPVRITVEEIRRRIGLSTNATPMLDARFERELVRAVVAQAEADVTADLQRLAAQREVDDDEGGGDRSGVPVSGGSARR